MVLLAAMTLAVDTADHVAGADALITKLTVALSEAVPARDAEGELDTPRDGETPLESVAVTDCEALCDACRDTLGDKVGASDGLTVAVAHGLGVAAVEKLVEALSERDKEPLPVGDAE